MRGCWSSTTGGGAIRRLIERPGHPVGVSPPGDRRAVGLGGSHLGSPRTLGALLDLELDSLATDEAIKVER
jgi:hypothetical protein